MVRKKRALLVGLAAMPAIAILSGCGVDHPPTAPVSGTVTVDGESVEGAAVMFVPQEGGRPASGTTDAQGRFTLRTFEPRDGALLGKHNVSITLAKTKGGPAVEEEGTMGEMTFGSAQTEWIVPQKYSDPKTSGLSKTVTDDGEKNKFTFDLKTSS